jgi:hypothetical protein
MGDHPEELLLRQNMKSANLSVDGTIESIRERLELIKINDDVVKGVYNLIKKAKKQNEASCHAVTRHDLIHRLQSLGIYVTDTTPTSELCLRWRVAQIVDDNYQLISTKTT